jgi:hypothetical protein
LSVNIGPIQGFISDAGGSETLCFNCWPDVLVPIPKKRYATQMVDEPTRVDDIRMIAIARSHLAMGKLVSERGPRTMIE